MIDLQQLKIVCWKNKCIVLDYSLKRLSDSNGKESCLGRPSLFSNALLVESFVRNLSQALQSSEKSLKGCCLETCWHMDVIRQCAFHGISNSQFLQTDKIPFEMLALDNAFHTLIGKFSNHLSAIKEVFGALQRETIMNPTDKVLRRIIAFRKSLIAFEQSVRQTEDSIRNILSNPALLSNLYLGENIVSSEHEEVELILEGYLLDIQEIQFSSQAMLLQLDDTKEYITTQVNESRNRIIRMSLSIEMCMLGLTFGACFASLFGMNLKSGLEDHGFAFFITVGSIVASTSLIIGFLIWRCITLMNLNNHHQHSILETFIKYIDVFEFLRIHGGTEGMTKENLHKQLVNITNKIIPTEDIDLIFHTFEKHSNKPLSNS